MRRKVTHTRKNSTSRQYPAYRILASRTGLTAGIIEEIMWSFFDVINRARKAEANISIGRFVILNTPPKRKHYVDGLPTTTIIGKSGFKKHIQDIGEEPINYAIVKEMYENDQLQEASTQKYYRPRRCREFHTIRHWNTSRSNEAGS